MALTYRIEQTDDTIIAWIEDESGNPVVYQPHHPQAFNSETWKSVADAEKWAKDFLTEREASEKASAEARPLITELAEQLATMQAELNALKEKQK